MQRYIKLVWQKRFKSHIVFNDGTNIVQHFRHLRVLNQFNFTNRCIPINGDPVLSLGDFIEDERDNSVGLEFHDDTTDPICQLVIHESVNDIYSEFQES